MAKTNYVALAGGALIVIGSIAIASYLMKKNHINSLKVIHIDTKPLDGVKDFKLITSLFDMAG